jgi:hypothetical protein
MQTIRALFHGHQQWEPLVRPAAFAINTAVSRTLGVSPFTIVHGFAPRLPIHQALNVTPQRAPLVDADADDEPYSFSQHLITTTAAMFAQVRDIQKRIYEKDLAAVRQHAHGQTDYKDGDHVLVFFPRPDKLGVEWRGPFQVTHRENRIIYVVADLVTKDSFRVHVNRMHLFHPGNLTPEQLAAESAREDEYYIEAVHDHEHRGKELWFRVKWLGYPEYAPDDPDAWVCLADCRHAPAIKDYRHKHDL